LNERVGPDVGSCADIQGPNVCEDAIIADCVGGEIQYTFCEDQGLGCYHVDDVIGFQCGCVSAAECPAGQTCEDHRCVPQAQEPVLVFARYLIVGDDNGDGAANPGETISLNVWLKNQGAATATDVSAMLSSTDAAVTISNWNEAFFGDVMSDAEASGSNPVLSSSYQFTVAQGVQDGHAVQLALAIQDRDGATWNASFNVPITKSNADLTFDHYVIATDDSHDGQVNRGETIGLNVWLRNQGASGANQVVATLTSSDPYVTVYAQDEAVFDDVAAGATAEGLNAAVGTSYRFTVAQDAPSGHELVFSLAIGDELGGTWTAGFTIPVAVTGADIVFSRYVITEDDNSNGALNPGETIQFEVWLTNSGGSSAFDVEATLSSTDQYVTIDAHDSATFGYEFLPGAEVKGYNPYLRGTFRLTASAATPIGQQVPLSLAIVDGASNTWSAGFEIEVQ
jgi:hypothetical protein